MYPSFKILLLRIHPYIFFFIRQFTGWGAVRGVENPLIAAFNTHFKKRKNEIK